VVEKIYPSHSRSQHWLILNIKQDTEASLENSVDNVAADGGSRAKDSSIAHLLAEFFALLFQFTILATLGTDSRTGLSELKRHIAIVGGSRDHGWPFLFHNIDIATRENSFLVRAFVPTSPPVIVHVF